MRKSMLTCCLVAVGVALCLLGSPATAAEVSQGKCIQYDEAAHKITIEAYDLQFSKAFPYGRPTGVIEDFDVASAAIGIQPQPGDILRLAWKDRSSVRTALKVMNVSKQDLRKK